ncbi:hypothetical protein Acid345_0521 [Candidatus Koribacter versatilis Ellin345]|uniref:PilZ domain-containing protein n=1 Tax=Koribacter versatilis (strain Ellin345) TaxID=204669 RepID=Q1IUC4_KORVE|nr:PilZ domain-containing protein [Candidatus Koribacter versatilis]ABF39526.1 hypothetical protein Acid345_0521 [Candidatus Koribacter versatilis Ellin345]
MESTRKYARYPVDGSADLIDHTNGRCWGHLGDISLGGFYVSTFAPWPINTDVRFKLEIDDHPIYGTGIVATSHPGVGMAVVYREMESDDRHELEHVIGTLDHTGTEAACVGLRV